MCSNVCDGVSDRFVDLSKTHKSKCLENKILFAPKKIHPLYIKGYNLSKKKNNFLGYITSSPNSFPLFFISSQQALACQDFSD